MPIFDLTSGIKAQHRTGATPQDAYEIMKRIVVTFAKRGYAIDWLEQKPPDRIVANLTDKEGTDLKAEITIVDEGTVTRCDIGIRGRVFLGGLLGRIVTANTIQSRAQEKIKELLDEEFRGQPSKRSPVQKSAAPPPAAPPSAKPPAPPPTVTNASPKAEAPLPKPAPAPVVTRTVEPAAVPLHGDPIRKAAAAAGARGVADLGSIVPLQRDLVAELAKAKGKSESADTILARIGASEEQQRALVVGIEPGAWLKSSAAAYALTWAVGEAASRALSDTPPADEVLQALFESTYERVLGEKVSAHASSSLGDKLEQVREAYEAALLSEAEMLRLRERVLFGF